MNLIRGAGTWPKGLEHMVSMPQVPSLSLYFQEHHQEHSLNSELAAPGMALKQNSFVFLQVVLARRKVGERTESSEGATSFLLSSSHT